MRLPLRLLLLFLSGCGAAAQTGPPALLPAPQNLKILLYNTEQALSWDPVSPHDGTGLVVYQVQYKLTSSNHWHDVIEADTPYVNCTNITTTTCDFTAGRGFWRGFSLSLRVRAQQGPRSSAWAYAPQFWHYLNVTIGPPKILSVKPGKGSLIVTVSEPFEIPENPTEVFFQYFVCLHREEERCKQEQDEGPFYKNLFTLPDLTPSHLYCLRVRAQVVQRQRDDKPQEEFWEIVSERGHYSGASCGEPGPDAAAEMQQVILLTVGTFVALATLAGLCLFLVLRYGGLVKLWFHTPPSVPLQIQEYLKDPAQPILEILDKDSSPQDDTWDRVSIVLSPSEKLIPGALCTEAPELAGLG